MDTTIIAALITGISIILAAIIQAKKAKHPAEKTKEVAEKKGQKEALPSDGVVSIAFFRGVILALFLSVLFGFSHIIGKHIVDDKSIDPVWVVTGRNIVSGVVVLLFAIFVRARSLQPGFGFLFNMDSFFMIIGRSFSALFYFMAFAYLTASETITLYKTNPLFIFLIILLIIKNPLPRISFLNISMGVILVVAGSLALVSKDGISREIISSQQMQGALFSVLAGLFWAVFMVSSHRYNSLAGAALDYWGRQRNLAYIYLLSSIPLIIICFSVDTGALFNKQPQEISLEFLINIVILGAISGVIGIIYFEINNLISPILSTSIISLEIFFTILLENVFLGAPFSGAVFMSGILIVIGSVSIAREHQKIRL